MALLGIDDSYGQSRNYYLMAENTSKNYLISQRVVELVWNKDELDVWEGFNTVYNGLQRWVTPIN